MLEMFRNVWDAQNDRNHNKNIKEKDAKEKKKTQKKKDAKEKMAIHYYGLFAQ